MEFCDTIILYFSWWEQTKPKTWIVVVIWLQTGQNQSLKHFHLYSKLNKQIQANVVWALFYLCTLTYWLIHCVSSNSVYQAFGIIKISCAMYGTFTVGDRSLQPSKLSHYFDNYSTAWLQQQDTMRTKLPKTIPGTYQWLEIHNVDTVVWH